MKTKAVEIAKAWSDQHATEWAMRNYLAVKMLLASHLLLTAPGGLPCADAKNRPTGVRENPNPRHALALFVEERFIAERDQPVHMTKTIRSADASLLQHCLR
jgi:hypothetical protein